MTSVPRRVMFSRVCAGAVAGSFDEEDEMADAGLPGCFEQGVLAMLGRADGV
jgi:hypothetical protein